MSWMKHTFGAATAGVGGGRQRWLPACRSSLRYSHLEEASIRRTGMRGIRPSGQPVAIVGRILLLSRNRHSAAECRGSRTRQLQHRFLRQFGSASIRIRAIAYSWVRMVTKAGLPLCGPFFCEQRAGLDRDRAIGDHPQIVLHILALASQRAVVAEVVFPVSFTIQKSEAVHSCRATRMAVYAAASEHALAGRYSERLVLQLASQACHHPCGRGAGGPAFGNVNSVRDG